MRSAGLFALLTAVLIAAARIAQFILGDRLSLNLFGPLVSTLVWTLLYFGFLPLGGAGLSQLLKRPSARFVFGVNSRLDQTLLSMLLGLSAAVVSLGLSLLLMPLLGLETVTPGPLLLTEMTPFRASLTSHLLVFAAGVLLPALCLDFIAFGYVAPALDIGEHRLRAVVGSGLFYALLFPSLEQAAIMFLFGMLFALVRLATDSLAAALAGQITSFLLVWLAPAGLDWMKLRFFGQSALDRSHEISLALLLILGGATLFVPAYVFLSGMWRLRHFDRLREALGVNGDQVLPDEPERRPDVGFVLALLLLFATIVAF